MLKQLMTFSVLGVITTASCAFAQDKSAGGTGGAKPMTIGMSQSNLGEPWRVQMNADIRKAAELHPELKVIYKDAQADSLKQRAHVEEFVRAGVDLIIISPHEAVPLAGPVSAAFKKGIPVVVVDREVTTEDYTVFIGADNRKIGKAAGEYIRKVLGGKGNVVELKGLMTTMPGRDRHAGFLEGIKGSDVKVVFEADTKWLEPNARKEMESALARQKDINLVYGHNDPAAHGAWLAARSAGREKQMKFVGIDALPQEGQNYVRQGILDASFEYPTGGKEAIQAALDIRDGKQVPKKIVLPSKVFTKDNIANGGELIEGE